MRSALARASVGTWHWDLEAGTLAAEGLALGLLGVPADAPITYRRFLAAVHPEDRACVARAARNSLSGDGEFDSEFRCVSPDQSLRFVAARGGVLRDAVGRPSWLEGVAFDITKKKQASVDARLRAERVVADREMHLALAIEDSPALIAVVDREMRYLATSRRWRSSFGIDDSQSIVGRSHYELFPDLPQRWRDIHERCLAGAVERCDEDPFPRPDGGVDWYSWEVHPWRTPTGEIGGIAVFTERITERKRAEDELRLSEERLRLAITGGALGTWHWDLRTGELMWSELSYALFGIPPETPMDFEKFIAGVHPDDRANVHERVERALRDRTDYHAEFRVRRPDGEIRWVGCKARLFDDGHGEPVRFEGVALDISAHKQVEEALRQGELRFRHLAEAVPHLVWQLDPSGAVIYANQRWMDYFGRTSLEFFEWNQVIHRDDAARVTAAFAEMTRREHNIEAFRMRRQDGTYHWFYCRSVPVFDADGTLLHVVGTSTDVDKEKLAEEELWVSRALLETALRAAGMGTGVWDIESGRMLLDDSLTQLLGLSPEQSEDATLERMMARVHPDDRELLGVALARVRDHRADYDVEFRLERPDGQMIWLACKGRLEADSTGRPRRLLGACVDITHNKRLEEDLRQAQKMEAIGQLAGGVAHDFNNLLTVILGQASVLGRRRDLPLEASASVKDIASAAQRAASLTAQLLAFGRRQVMQLRDIALDDVIASIGTMLERLLGEDVAVEFVTTEPGLRVRADSNMLAQVLLNLTVNARDAMPHGGRLTIRTAVEHITPSAAEQTPGASPGAWACLSVSDTGAGISPEVLPRIFEPFFTTKDVGKGTGLGLATVYGIVKQHRGWVSVESAAGRGTTFKTYFPVASEGASSASDEPHDDAERGRGELVMVVEDDVGVRALAERLLAQHGYRLLVVNDGREALRVFRERGPEIDLLLTDIVMPHGVTGTDLVAELVAKKPGLKAILCSGYSAETVGRGIESLPGAAFLQKPYRPEELLRLVRRVLDE